jgi:ribosomal protein L10
MPKQLKPKIFKVTRKNINDDKNNFVIRWKNLSKEQIKQLRIELDDVVAHYFVKQEAPSEY